MATNFLDAFEDAMEAVGLAPPVLTLHRGEKDDPSQGMEGPFAIYSMSMETGDRVSTNSATRARILDLNIFDYTEGKVMDWQRRVSRAIYEKTAGIWFHEWMLPDDESVLSSEVYLATHSIDDDKKRASGLWLTTIKLRFTVRWNRG